MGESLDRSKIVKIASGILLVILGLAIGWLPGPVGFLAILGLALLVPYVPGMARLMDRAEKLYLHATSE